MVQVTSLVSSNLRLVAGHTGQSSQLFPVALGGNAQFPLVTGLRFPAQLQSVEAIIGNAERGPTNTLSKSTASTVPQPQRSSHWLCVFSRILTLFGSPMGLEVSEPTLQLENPEVTPPNSLPTPRHLGLMLHPI